MRRWTTLLFFAAFGAAVWWYWDDALDLKQHAFNYIENGDFLTLEARYSPERIMEARRQELLGNSGRTYLDPIAKFSPYLLMEVKYLQDGKSKEGAMLWGMLDGEMVLNTDTWETTHGFEDCLNAGACSTDFKIIQALAKNKGSLSREDLQVALNLEQNAIDSWIETARQKHLVVQKGNLVQLHFENPKISLIPQTKMKQSFVTKGAYRTQRMPARYSKSKIIKTAQAAFGNDFTIRTEQEVFLPIYTIEVQNPDGSIRRSDWNALTGEAFLSKPFVQ